MFKKHQFYFVIFVLAFFVASFAFVGCGPTEEATEVDEEAEVVDEEAEPDEEGPVFGGTLEVAAVGQPSTMDGHWTTAHTTHALLYQTHETLFTIDEDYEVVPMLADSYTQSEDGLEISIFLREGVLFHNGKEMVADDVVASLKRWGEKMGPGQRLFADIEDISAVSDYEVKITLTEPTGAVMPFLGIQSANPWIYPAESIEAAGEDELTEFYGTGPFKFDEFVPDQYVRLERFGDYVARSEPASGMGGEKVAYVDEIYFRFLPDASVRAASVEGGESHFAEAVNYDEYDRFIDNPNIEPIVVMPRITVYARLNTAEGILSDVNLRRAFQIALDCEDIMRNTIGIEDLYIVSPSLMTSLGPWGNTNAGADVFNQADYDRAGEILEEAGYDGTPIRWITSREYPYMYNSAMAATQHLEAAGFVVDLQVLEWAQLTETRSQPGEWDVFSTGIGNTLDPSLWIALDSSWPGWWDSEEKNQLVEDLWRAPTFEERKAIWDQLQELYYEEQPLATMGETGTMHVISPNLQNVVPHPNPFYWNIWIEN